MPHRRRSALALASFAVAFAVAVAVALAAVLPAAPAAAQDPERSVLTQDTAPLDNPSHLDLQRSVVAWLACTEATPDDIALERVQRRLLATAPTETEAEAVAALEQAAREMGEIIEAEGCAAPRVDRAIALFDVYLRPALSP